MTAQTAEPSKPAAPPRASREAPKEPSTLAELEEAVRERLHQNHQHGAIGLFNKYVAAVSAKLAQGSVAVKVKPEVVKVDPTPSDSTGPIDAASKPKRASKAK